MVWSGNSLFQEPTNLFGAQGALLLWHGLDCIGMDSALNISEGAKQRQVRVYGRDNASFAYHLIGRGASGRMDLYRVTVI